MAATLVAVPLDDPLLPAARHLVGTDAADLLRAAVVGFGGDLVSAQAVQVQHRPGHDLVVRFDAQVAWAGRPARRETLLAAATTHGAPPGTLTLTADDVDMGALEAGVWRYPFDPRLPGLADAVTPGRVDRLLADVLPGPADLEVVAYRPIRRAVVRAVAGDREAYLKVVRPSETTTIAARHRALRDAGLPVPEVQAVDEANGILVMEALEGQNLRDRLLGATTGWPPASAYLDLMTALGAVVLPSAPTPSRLSMTPAELTEGHARALTAILPREEARLARITAAVQTLDTSSTATQTVHGDLYEAQLMVDGSCLTGLLDLDDVGPGHVLDDPATLLAHLAILQPTTRRHRDHLRRYRDRLRHAFVEGLTPDGDATPLDLRTAGALVGLATGPFRAQRSRWQAEVRRRIAMAERLVTPRGSQRERTLRCAS